MNLLNYVNSIILNEKDFIDKIRYNKDGYYTHQKVRKKSIMVSVIVPVYNAEDTLSKTLDSIIAQSIGLDNLEVLIIDDMSDDNSREIVLKYAKKYPNISPVFLKDNTGSPAIPRNLGINLAKGKYITFIDSDDWFHENGIKILYDLLENTNDNYAVGKTIRLSDKGQHIIGKYNSWQTRKSIRTLSIDRVFQHLGPTGRMIRTSFLKTMNITFPDKKYAEDKQFFTEVLVNCPTISTTKEIVYYVNRYSDNESLVKQTDIFEKTDANISVLKYLMKRELPIEAEKMIFNRIYEFDCITRFFNKGHFLKSDNKKIYYDKFKEVLETTSKLQYNFEDNFKHDWHRILLQFFKHEEYDKLTALIDWSLNNRIKDIIVKDDLPYYAIKIGSEQYLARIEMYTKFISSYKNNDKLHLSYEIYGDHINNLGHLVIRQRDNDLNIIELPIIHKSGNKYESIISLNAISELDSSSYVIFVKYNGYQESHIKMNTREILVHNQKKLDFYTTIGDNYGLIIK